MRLWLTSSNVYCLAHRGETVTTRDALYFIIAHRVIIILFSIVVEWLVYMRKIVLRDYRAKTVWQVNDNWSMTILSLNCVMDECGFGHKTRCWWVPSAHDEISSMSEGKSVGFLLPTHVTRESAADVAATLWRSLCLSLSLTKSGKIQNALVIINTYRTENQ